MKAKAIYACIAENPGEITFDAGDTLVQVTSSPEDGWFEGAVQGTGERGLFPVVYAELIPEVGDDVEFLKRLQAEGLLSSTLELASFKRELDTGRLPPPLPQKPASIVQSRANAPPIPTKPQTLSAKPTESAYRPAPPLAPKPKPNPKPTAVGAYTAHLNQQPNNEPPPLPRKPLSIDHSDAESRHQKEREEAERWEAMHRIGGKSKPEAISKPAPAPPPAGQKPAINPSAKPAIGTKPVFLSNRPTPSAKPALPTASRPVVPAKPEMTEKPKGYVQQATVALAAVSSHPSTENDAPPLPQTPSRRPIPDPKLQQPASPAIHPALESVPPPLPYHPTRRAVPEPVKPVEDGIQPHPKNLIHRINTERNTSATVTRTNSSASLISGFEDSFNPAAITTAAPAPAPASVAATLPPLQPTGAVSGSIPLTESRQIRGTVPPVPTRRANTQLRSSPAPVLPPKPSAMTGQASALHQPALPLPRYNSMALKSPRSSTIHPSTYPPTGEAIPADALARYSHLFKRLDKQHGKRGYLTTEEVHAVVGRSRLPDDQMRRIWALSDRNLNGRFGPGEFNIIMHLIDCSLRNDPIPSMLSVDLVQSAYSV